MSRAASQMLWGFAVLAYSFGLITLAASMWPVCQ
jgi:hypothetical protein